MARHENLKIASAADFAAAFGVSHETSEKLDLYARLLREWQGVVNLVSPSSLPDLWIRHMADSAQLLKYAPPEAETWVDIGSGGGFPGLVVAILLANQKECVVHLVESNGRKCAFLSEVARRTGAPARIHNARIADLVESRAVPSADVVSARALAPLAALLELAQPLFGDASAGLFLKGREAASEIAAARKFWAFESKCHPSVTDPEGIVLEIRQPKLIEGGEK
jgi:16S rRNA (guanine527-N7)-methyltransferase